VGIRPALIDPIRRGAIHDRQAERVWSRGASGRASGKGRIVRFMQSKLARKAKLSLTSPPRDGIVAIWHGFTSRILATVLFYSAKLKLNF